MTLGLALGGGGVRGLAHVLALETLDAMGLEPACIAGTSMGAIVGALYASGLSGAQIHDGITQHIITHDDSLADIYRKKRELFKWFTTLRPAWGSTSGLLKADGFLNFLMEEIRVETFEELRIPLKVVATDFYSGKAVLFSQGSLFPAIQASMSIPGVFVPVEHEGRVLVDGGVADNLPYGLLLEQCDCTVAIDVAPTRDPNQSKAPNLIDAILGMFDTLVERVVSENLRQCAPTVYVRPRLVGIRTLDFDKIETVFDQARPAMAGLRDKLHAVRGDAENPA